MCWPGDHACDRGVSPRNSATGDLYKEGNTPRAHDHRACWRMMLDTCVSDTGTDAASSLNTRPESAGLPGDVDFFSPEVTAVMIARTVNRMPLDDSLVMCRFNNRGPGVDMDYLGEILKAVTGWDMTGRKPLLSATGSLTFFGRTTYGTGSRRTWMHPPRAMALRRSTVLFRESASSRYGRRRWSATMG